jgi:hypothetical protein
MARDRQEAEAVLKRCRLLTFLKPAQIQSTVQYGDECDPSDCKNYDRPEEPHRSADSEQKRSTVGDCFLENWSVGRFPGGPRVEPFTGRFPDAEATRAAELT